MSYNFWLEDKLIYNDNEFMVGWCNTGEYTIQSNYRELPQKESFYFHITPGDLKLVLEWLSSSEDSLELEVSWPGLFGTRKGMYKFYKNEEEIRIQKEPAEMVLSINLFLEIIDRVNKYIGREDFPRIPSGAGVVGTYYSTEQGKIVNE